MNNLPAPNFNPEPQPDQDDLRKLASLKMLASLDKTGLDDTDLAAYLVALKEFKALDVGIAVAKFIRGDVKDWDGKFRPNPPTLARVCASLSYKTPGFHPSHKGAMERKDGKLIQYDVKALPERIERDENGLKKLPQSFLDFKARHEEIQKNDDVKVKHEQQIQLGNERFKVPYGQLAAASMGGKAGEV